MDIFYNIVSLKHYTEPEELSSGEVVDFPLTETLAYIEVETFEEAVKALREQCNNLEATEVALYYYENCYGERWFFENDEQNPHEHSRYRYRKSEIDLFVADRKREMQERPKNHKKWNKISESNNFHCQFDVSHDEFDEEEVTGGYSIANVFIEDYDDAMFYPKQQSQNPDVNNIDMYVANGCSDRMISFCTLEHPYAEVGYTFDDIDEFARTERDAHNKRMMDPSPFDMEMQYIDLLAGITPEHHYRVTAHRMKKNVLNFRKRLDTGEQLRLDGDHKVMTKRIGDNFDSLYSTLIRHYNATLLRLKQEPEISALRQKHYNLTGLVLHDSEVEYGKLTATAFWNKLNRWLER